MVDMSADHAYAATYNLHQPASISHSAKVQSTIIWLPITGG